MSKQKTFFFLLLACALILAACAPFTPDASATALAQQAARLEQTQAAVESAIALTAAAPSATPTATITPTPTPTFTPTPTDTPTPTPTPLMVLPGVYDFGDLLTTWPFDIKIKVAHPITGNLSFFRAVGTASFRLHGVTVLEDRSLAFLVSYGRSYDPDLTTGRPPDFYIEGNQKIYITDAQANKYEVTTWLKDSHGFFFTAIVAPAPEGVYTFTYHDDTNQFETQPVTLNAPAAPLPGGKLGFSAYRFDPAALIGFREEYGSDGSLRLLMITDAPCGLQEIRPENFDEDIQGGEVIPLLDGRVEYALFPNQSRVQKVLVRKVEGTGITPEDKIAFAPIGGYGCILPILGNASLQPVAP
jgi:hypothetical protein